jgi:hypothetical protein
VIFSEFSVLPYENEIEIVSLFEMAAGDTTVGSRPYSRIIRSIKRFGCGEDKPEGLETIGSGQGVKGAPKNISAQIFPFQDP